MNKTNGWAQRRLVAIVLTIGCSAKSTSTDSSGLTTGIIRIDTNGVVVDEQDDERPWVDVTVEMVEGTPGTPVGVADSPTWSGFGAIHVRGNSTSDYDKKQYALETRDADGQDVDAAFFGLPEEEDWVLAAPFSDKTLMRNHLMFAWSRAIGHYAPRTRFVELYMEDAGADLGPEDYRGVYVLTEKVKRDVHRVNVAKLEPTDADPSVVTGGYLLRRDWVEAEPIETALYGDMLMLESPKADEVTAPQFDYIEGFLNDFESALSRADGSHDAFIDVDSFVDFMLMMELSRNVDAYVLSTYMHKPRGGRLTMGPIWDFNGSLGNADYFEAWRTEGWHYENPEFPADNPNGFHWYRVLLEDGDFQRRLAERWAAHRSGPWSDSALMKSIGDAEELLQGMQQRNFERWPVLGEQIWPNDEGATQRQTHEDEVDYLRRWVLRRTAWLDEQFGG